MKRPEEALHRVIVQYLRFGLPKEWVFWATPNQRGTRKAWEVKLLSGLGVRAGIPDLFVAGEGKVIGIEIKAPVGTLKSGSKSRAKPNLSQAQKDTIGALAEAGIPTIVVRSLDEAVEALRALGVPMKGIAL